MSVQEINNALALLQDKATDIAALEMRLNEEIAAAATPALPAPVEYGPLPLDRLIQDMAGQLSAMDSKTSSGTFRELFELSQAIDSAFAAAGREPPAKTGLVSGEVRRVHQLEAFLSVYREKLSTLDQQHKAGEIDDSSYAVMKSAWERTLESELAAIEGVE